MGPPDPGGRFLLLCVPFLRARGGRQRLLPFAPVLFIPCKGRLQVQESRLGEYRLDWPPLAGLARVPESDAKVRRAANEDESQPDRLPPSLPSALLFVDNNTKMAPTGSAHLNLSE